jgi:hypothetical protein
MVEDLNFLSSMNRMIISESVEKCPDRVEYRDQGNCC